MKKKGTHHTHHKINGRGPPIKKPSDCIYSSERERRSHSKGTILVYNPLRTYIPGLAHDHDLCRKRRLVPALVFIPMRIKYDAHNNMTKRPRYHGRSFLPAAAVIIVIFLNARVTRAFSTLGPHRSISAKGVSRHTIRQKSIRSRAYCPPYMGFNGQQSTRSMALQANSIDQEEFQRSLLEEKIANDIIQTEVKEEKERNEVVAKQIDKEKKELKGAVDDVKKAAKNFGGAVIGKMGNATNANATEASDEGVSQSGRNLGGAFLKAKVRLFTLLAKEEIR